ncbi:MAG: alpha/beta fold hydrolase, partial [Anaerolineae bacterium]
ELEEYRAVYVTTEFARATIDTQVVFDHNGQVAGLFFVPPRAPGGAGDASLEYYVSPDYVDTEAFEERNLVIGASGWVMPATFTFPVGEGPFPVVLLVHDSGPHDRDETVGLNKPFRDLAWGLASQGIAVLRYEKRTKTHPERIQAIQQRYTIYDEAVNDAVAAVSLLAKMKDVDAERVYVLGHGLGGMLVPRIGALAPDIAGFIVLAGTTRPLEDVYLAQVSYAFEFDGELSDQEQATLEEAKEQVARVKDPDLSAETPPSQLPRGIPGSYWLDLRGYDPAEAAKDLTQPMLVLQGERDFQITVEDFEGWRAALSLRTDVEFQLYPALNHLFVAGEGPSMPNEEYAAPGHVAAHVIGDIVDWIERH